MREPVAHRYTEADPLTVNSPTQAPNPTPLPPLRRPSRRLEPLRTGYLATPEKKRNHPQNQQNPCSTADSRQSRPLSNARSLAPLTAAGSKFRSGCCFLAHCTLAGPRVGYEPLEILWRWVGGGGGVPIVAPRPLSPPSRNATRRRLTSFDP